MMSSDRRRFEGRVAFVTGGASGIGLATAQAFAREGASVAVVGISEEPNQAAVRAIEALGGRAIAITCDVSQSADVQRAVRQTVDTFGRLDLAFNNAGIEQAVAPLEQISESAWEGLNAINLGGVFLCMKYQIPMIRRAGGGAIVNTASGAGVKGFKGQAAYAATKHGLIGLSKSAALDYAAEGIRINVVAPGIIDTAMMDRFTGNTEAGRQSVIAQEPVGRMGRPEEIAAAVLYVCSDEAAFTTGSVLVVDGGQTV